MTLDLALLRASWQSWYATDLRVVGPGWLQLLWTLVFSTAIGLIFFVLGLSLSVVASGRWPSAGGAMAWLWRNLLVAWTIGGCIHLLFALITPALGVERIRGFTGWRKSAFFGGVPMLGTAIGWPLGASLFGGQATRWFPSDSPGAIAGAILFGLLVSVLMHLHFDAKSRQVEAERRATEAQLRLLQAQIEPHFLFNTLANVHALIDQEPGRARDMLGAFTDYLRASLQGLRRDEVPLADELALAEAYLRVQQSRMEDRLRVSFDIADSARGMAVPPLLLQPLVENAVHHGIEPQLDGGSVRVSARVDGGRLIVDVVDDGRGLQAPTRRAGAGLALANIRDRLQARHRQAARLTLLPRDPGTCARIELPATPFVAPARPAQPFARAAAR